MDEHGYLVDIVNIEANLDQLVEQYRHKTLNNLEEFNGLNPSIEHFARIFCEAFIQRVQTDNLHAIQVNIWERDIAWAGYRMEL